MEVKSSPPQKKIKLEKTEKQKQSFTLVNDKLSKPLPDPFPFPDNYSPEITIALTKKVMPPKTLEKFITAVAIAAFALKCYPTSQELERLAIQAIEKWEFLRAPQGSPYVSKLVILNTVYMMSSFLGSHLDRDEMSFQRIPKNASKHGSCKGAIPQQREAWSDTSTDDGEDAVSYERHIKALSAEYRKAKPNEGVVTELMAITFRQRRQEIVEKAMPELLLKFPFLRHYGQVCSVRFWWS